VGSDFVDDDAGFDDTRPAGKAGHSKTAFPGGAFLTAERRVAAVRPRECLRAVIAGEDNDSVVRGVILLLGNSMAFGQSQLLIRLVTSALVPKPIAAGTEIPNSSGCSRSLADRF
jgi:hypothetical protein